MRSFAPHIRAVCLLLAGPSILSAQTPVQTFEIHAKRFAFVPSEITVRKGEPVTLTVISDDVPHSLLIEDLDVDVAASKGHPSQVTFSAGKPGDFKGRCGKFCGAGHGQMRFVVHVTN